MRKALASIVILAFVGLLLTSLLAIFSGNVGTRFINSHSLQYPYFMAY